MIGLQTPPIGTQTCESSGVSGKVSPMPRPNHKCVVHGALTAHIFEKQIGPELGLESVTRGRKLFLKMAFEKCNVKVGFLARADSKGLGTNCF
jgi:hypothetical protein